MDTLRLILLIAHGIGLLAVLGGILGQFRLLRRNAARVTPIVLGGAALLLLTGLGLAGLIISFGTPNYPKLAVKLTIALAIFVGLLVHRRGDAKTPMLLGMAGLAVANAIIAAAW